MATLISSPTTISVVAPATGVPNYIANLAPGAALQLSTRISDAFVGFSGEAGDPIGIYAYSGGAYDTRRGRYMRSGGGHNDHNGNGVYGLSLYSSETPVWTLFRPHTSPPSVTSFGSGSVETAPNGDPASSHTYSQIVYDGHADKLLLFGLGSAAGSNGASFARLRLLNLSTNQWDPVSSTLQGAGGSMYSAAAAYDSAGRAVIGSGGTSTGRWYRYDCASGTLSQLNVSGVGARNIDSAAAIDPARRYMVIIGGYGDVGPLDSGAADMILLDLASLSGTNITGYSRTLAGFPAVLRQAKIGLEFHPPSGSFVAWNGGNALYRLIPPANPFTGAWTFQTLVPGGSGLPAMGSGSLDGVYSKFRWAPYPSDPSRGVFVMDCAQGSSGNYVASRTTIYKPNF